MAEAWTEVPFEDVIDFQEGPGIMARDFRDAGIPLVRLAGLERGAGSVLDGCNYLDPTAVEKRWSHFSLQPGDVLLSTSASLGRIAVVGDDAAGAIAYTGIIRMRPRDERLFAPFIRYLLGGPDFQRQAEMVGVGSVIRHFGPMHLRQMTVAIPPIDEQRAIADILGALDHKIDLNRRMTKTLEAMTRGLFKSWFVDFDPVRARTEGDIPGAPHAIVGASPDRIAESDLGPIPNGWGVASIGDVADVIDCLHSKKPERRDVGRPLLQLWNIRDDGLIDLSDPYLIDEDDYVFWTSRMEARSGDCVITNVGRAGAVAQIPEGVQAALGRNMTGIRCRTEFEFPTFLLECLLSEAMRGEITRRLDTGTILDALNVRSIPKLRFVMPSRDVADTFEQFARPVRRRMELTFAHSQTLAETRDALLPKLLSGQITVSQAERVLEASTA
jgi:type I restriction enzyme S subunit